MNKFDQHTNMYSLKLIGIGLTILATAFLFFVYFFDWIIYGQSKFTLVKMEHKTECKSRSLPITGATMCGAQDLNTRVKIRFDDSYFVVDTNGVCVDSQSTRRRPLCLETDNLVNEITSSKKLTRSIQLGNSNVLLERPYGQTNNIGANRLVA